MKNRLRFLNLLLVVACGLVGWQMRANHLQHQARLDRTFSYQATGAATAELAIEPLAQPPQAAEFSQVAMRMLFAQDRNPNIVEEKKVAPEPKKMPELPVLHGVMNLGDGLIAMMSTGNSDHQGSYKVGDTIGEFEIVTIATDRITFKWDGKEVTKLAAELKASGARPTRKGKLGEIPKPAAAAKAPPPANAKPGPGKDLGGRERACQPGDNSPDGTVVDGYVKRTVLMPMGSVCLWEPIAKN